jgi:hypothetical protein
LKQLFLILFFIFSGLARLDAIDTIEELDRSAAFSFSIISDNKGDSPIDNIFMHKCDNWIKQAGDKFVIGLGDHIKKGFTNTFLDFIGPDGDPFWYHHFYPNVADGECEYWGNGQGDWGAGYPIIEWINLLQKDNVSVRENKCEYYAVVKIKGIAVHIIQLHFSDNPADPAIAFNESSRKYLLNTLDSIEKTSNDLIIILAHSRTGEWIPLLNPERRKKVLNKADLVLSATTHDYKRYRYDGFKDNGALCLNSGSVSRAGSGGNGFLQVHVFKYPTRFIVQYQSTDNNKRKLRSNGFAYLKYVNGNIYDAEWGKFLTGIDSPEQKYDFFKQKFDTYEVILTPDKNAPEWWAGAPSVVRDDAGVFWMANRMRTADSPRGLRGYEVRISKSEDGIHFKKVMSIPREKIPIPGFERPALLIDPQTKKFKLYICGPWQNGPWSIMKFSDVSDLKNLDFKSAKPVIVPMARRYERDVSVLEYKDPFILYAEGNYHCYVTGYVRRNERIFHFISGDGENWKPVGDVNQPVMDLNAWHNFFIRPASVLPIGVGYLFIYEGSSTQWYDPVYNVVTGFGFTFDLHHIIDLTEISPIAISTTPGDFHTFRYSHWMWVDNEIWIYAEVARENNSNEIRLFRLKTD